MANVTCERRKDKVLYRVEFYDADRRRKKIRLGAVTKRDAESIASRIDELVSSSIAGTPPRPALAEWITSLGDDLHAKLATAGLIEARKTTSLGPFVDEWLERQKADNAASTIKNLQPFMKGLFEFFGRDRDIRTITSQDADNWRRSLVEQYAKATVAKRIKVAKQVFRSAVRLNVITQSPFSSVPVGSQVNDERNQMIPMEWIHKVLEQEHDPEFRLIVMLARIGGLRTPSEPLQLRWEDINWAEGTFLVRSPKTRRHHNASRCVPLFQELEPFLSDVFHRAPEGATYIITKYRDSAVNLRTRFERAILRAGLQPWPRLFQNCRSSRETELADEYPVQCVAQWLGHSPKISLAHYLKTTKEHIARANGRSQSGGGATGGAVTDGNQGKASASSVQKTSVNQGSVVISEGTKRTLNRPGGIRDNRENSRKTSDFQSSGATGGENDLQSRLAQATSLANSNLTAAAAGEALAAISCWLRDLAQLHSIEATIDSHGTLCQLVDALASRGVLSRTQAAQVGSAGQSLAACVYGAPRSSQSLVPVLNAAADLLQGK